MFKLLVNTPSGEQSLIEVGEGGGYFELERVIWDDRIDGEFPAELIASVGGLIRNGANLEFNQTRQDEHDAALAAQAAEIVAARRAAAIELIANGQPSHNEVVASLRVIVLLMIDEINILRQCNMVHRGIAASGAVTSIATLKTAMLNNLPTTNDRTLAQLKTAIQNKINAGDAD